MTITQTVEIPADHRLTIDVPREIPAGRAVLAFTLTPERKSPDRRSEEQRAADDDGLDFDNANEVGDECPICAANRDPVTGNPRYKPEVYEGMQEVEDMISGKIPVQWHTSLDDLDKMLGL